MIELFSGNVIELSGDNEQLICRKKVLQTAISNFPNITFHVFVSKQTCEILKFQGNNVKVNVIDGTDEDSIISSLECLNKLSNAVYLSAGNTKTIIKHARNIIPRLYDCKRIKPALFNTYPVHDKFVIYSDMGASLSLSKESLVWQTCASIKLVEELFGEKAVVGLFNVGAESEKGYKILQETNNILRNIFPDNFYGNIEPNDLVKKVQGVNAVVTAGFIGNFGIKNFEATASTFKHRALNTYNNSKSLAAKFLGAIGKLCFWYLSKFNWQELNWRLYSGAYLIGLEKMILITHGRSDDVAFYNAILRVNNAKTVKIHELILNSKEIKNIMDNLKTQTDPQS